MEKKQAVIILRDHRRNFKHKMGLGLINLIKR